MADNDGSSRKRQRPDHPEFPASNPSNSEEEESASKPSRRTRAPTACRLCRARKVKCTNEKPTCGACARLGVECTYAEGPKGNLHDEQTTKILSMLEEILTRMPVAPPPDPSVFLPPFHANILFPPPHSPGPQKPRVSVPLAEEQGLKQGPKFVSLDHVFQWPVFSSYEEAQLFTAEKLLIAHHTGSIVSARLNLSLIDEGEIFRLVQNFLRYAHIKNPILDSKTLLGYTRSVAEYGLQWDTKTCLVLVAAALGVLAKPFNPVPVTTEHLLSTATLAQDRHILEKADAYFQLAKRRFGLLDSGLAACHCHLMAATYLMYTLRPVEAWRSFFQASTLYTLYLRGGPTSQSVSNDHDQGVSDSLQTRLEQRLYWSCLKGENEICAEISMPRSSLFGVDYPHMFPSPPTLEDEPELPSWGGDTFTWQSTPGSNNATATPDLAPAPDHSSLQEQTWFYYLSEISMLRLAGRIEQTFYAEHSSSWLQMNMLDMISAAQEYEGLLHQWRGTLPSAISCFDTSREPGTFTELQLVTWMRYTSLEMRLYRPFIYRLVHAQDSDWPLRGLIQPFAEKALSNCLDPRLTVGLEHRHAGAWYRARESAARALIILCAKKIGLTQSLQNDTRATYMLDIFIAHLQHWEDETPDLRMARQIIERIRADVEGREV